MIFKRRKGRPKQEEEENEEEREQVLFQGALSGREVDLAANARLVEAGLPPAKQLVSDALNRRAHVLRIDPKGQAAAVIMVVDGVPYPGGRLSKQQALAATQMVKLLAGLDTKQRTKPQSGGIKAEYLKTPYELQVISTPVTGGAERLDVRVRNLTEKLARPDDVGFTDELRAKIRELGSRKQGMLLVCGPRYSGTTTTTYVVLRTIDAYIYSILNIADVGDRDVFGVTEFEANPEDDLKATIQRMIRSEADVIFLDPLRDAETAKLLFSKQDETMFLTEFTAKDAAQGVLQLIAWLGDAKKVAEGLGHHQPEADPETVREMPRSVSAQPQDRRQGRAASGDENAVPAPETQACPRTIREKRSLSRAENAVGSDTSVESPCSRCSK